MKKTVEMYNSDFKEVLTDIPNLRFLDFDEENPEVKATTTEISGSDGVLLGPSNFGPFNLILRFFYTGEGVEDYNLFKQKLRSILFRRDPYFIKHSDRPGVKYAVYCDDNAITDIGTRFGQFEITFVCYKGYSESYRDTSDIELLQEHVQFEQGLGLSDKLKYKHQDKSFSIHNGSTDKIDPLLRHKLIIQMTVEAPNGFKIRNKTTGDVFEYKKAIKKSQKFILNGVYPFVDSKRVGVDTNYGYITLAPGNNNIVIEGDGVEKIDIDFTFNYIYR